MVRIEHMIVFRWGFTICTVESLENRSFESKLSPIAGGEMGEGEDSTGLAQIGAETVGPTGKLSQDTPGPVVKGGKVRPHVQSYGEDLE